MVTRLPLAASAGETVTVPFAVEPGWEMGYVAPDTVEPPEEPPPPEDPALFQLAAMRTSWPGITKVVVLAEASARVTPVAVQPLKA